MTATLDGLVEGVSDRPRDVCLVVAGADLNSTLDAAIRARQKKIVQTVVLIDDRRALETQLRAAGESTEDYVIEDVAEEQPIAELATRTCHRHRGALLMKGRIPTDVLLRSVLFGEDNLSLRRLLSDVLITANPVSAAPKLIGITDGGVNVSPGLEAKGEIVKNAVAVFHSLGIDEPKVALLCASEKVSPSMPHTDEAKRLAAMSRDGEIAGCIVDGPLALDNALSEEAVRIKEIDSPVAGDADILVTPTIEAGNILGKSFRYLAGAPSAHVIEGAKVPVLIPSRTESADDKLYSIALGALRSGGQS